MKIYKRTAALLALCLTGAMFTACGSKNNADNNNTGTTSGTTQNSVTDNSRTDDNNTAGNNDTITGTGDIDGDGFIEDVAQGAEDIVDGAEDIVNDAVDGAENIIDDITPGEHDNNTVTTTDNNG